MKYVGTKEIVPYQLYVPPLECSLLEVLLYLLISYLCETVATTAVVLNCNLGRAQARVTIKRWSLYVDGLTSDWMNSNLMCAPVNARGRLHEEVFSYRGDTYWQWKIEVLGSLGFRSIRCRS